MSESGCKQYSWFKSWLVTTLFCVAISVTTQSIWGGPLFTSAMISFGFGYSAVFSSFVLIKLFPDTSRLLEIAISMVFALTFGTLNAHYWLNGFFGEGISELKSVIFLGVIFCSVSYYYFYTREQKLRADNELEVAKRRQADQEKVVVLSQLKQLQSQIEPHFLFNTLATVSALIETDSDKAKLMLDKLTELLRVTLRNSRSEQSTIAQESDLLDAYLNIQKIRLGERLTFSIDKSQIDSTQVLPPFLIQPLVENALTHGIEPKAEGGEISIRFSAEQEYLTIDVVDNGLGLSSSSTSGGHGVGLSNIRQRIAMLFDDQASLSIKEQAAGGVVAQLKLPLSGQ